jgi:predicted DNA-binding protein (MmcQ/YjbR family)
LRLAALRRFCLALPGASETVQWGEDRVYKVGGKMFAVCGMDGRRLRGLSIKVSDDSALILTRLPGIVPAPYLARAGWVRLDRLDRLPPDQLRGYVRRSHALVVAGLSRRRREGLGAA